MEKDRLQMSESFALAAMLAIVGGFLDAYSYILRGNVFANAQTGNIVLLGICFQKGEIRKGIYYLIPITAFAMGVILVEVVKKRYKKEEKIHWRQRILALEIFLLLIVGMIPLGAMDVAANILISFVCAMQVETFRKVHGHPFASTMCTGNLRSGTESFWQYFQTGDKRLCQKGMKYYGIIVCFIVGAVAGAILSENIGKQAVFICCGLLAAAMAVMVKEYRI